MYVPVMVGAIPFSPPLIADPTPLGVVVEVVSTVAPVYPEGQLFGKAVVPPVDVGVSPPPYTAEISTTFNARILTLQIICFLIDRCRS